MDCFVCGKKLSRRDLGLACVKCNGFFHAKCTKLEKDKFTEIVNNDLDWRCDKCIEILRKKRQTCYAFEAQPSTSFQDKENVVEDINSSYAAVVGELKKIAEVQKTFEKSLLTFSSLIDDFNKKINYFESKMKLIDQLVDENIELKTSVVNLNSRISEVEQCSRMNDIEITGIPERKSENLLLMAQSIGVAIKCPFTENDVDVVHRVQCFDKTKTKNIIVRFHSRQLKKKFIAFSRIHVREKGLLKMEHINYEGSGSFYVNEHLMPERKLLLLKCKKFCKENNIKYIWVKDCKILARKADHTKVKLVNTIDDLKHL